MMDAKLLDVLACPSDKHHPLELYGDGEHGALYCTKCSRFFMIDDGIPVMLPDELRNKDEEVDFLKAHSELPDKIRLQAKPWHL